MVSSSVWRRHKTLQDKAVGSKLPQQRECSGPGLLVLTRNHTSGSQLLELQEPLFLSHHNVFHVVVIFK